MKLGILIYTEIIRQRPFMLYLTEEINTNGVDGAQENRKCIL